MISRRTTPEDKAWEQRLHAAKVSRDEQKVGWDRNRRLLFPSFRGNKRRPVKAAWAAYQTMIGVIFAQTPSGIVREKKAGGQNVARLITQAAQQEFAEMHTRYVTRMCAQDVFWAGLGIALMRLDQEVDGGKPKNQRFDIERVHPEGFLRDPNGVDPELSDHKWVAREFYPTVARLKEDKDFDVSRSALAKMPRLYGAPFSPTGRKTDPTSNEPHEEEDDDFAQVRMQEVLDHENARLLYVTATEEGGALVCGEKDWPVEPRFRSQLLYPYNILYFNENSDDFWPIPEMTMIADEIEQLSHLDKQMFQDAITKWRVFLAKAGLLQKGHIEKLMIDGSKVKILSIDGSAVVGGQLEGLSLQDVLAPVPEPGVMRDVAAVAADKKQQIHETVGAGDFSSAGFRSTRSATEAAALSDFLRSRMNTRTENIDAFFSRQLRLLVLFMQETATEERWAEITDETGQKEWKSYTAEDIKGDFAFSVVAGSSMPKNTDSVRTRNIEFLNLVAPQVVQSGGDLWPLLYWIAPYYDIPIHMVDQLHSGHRAALQKVAEALAATQQGAQVPPEAFMEFVSAAVTTGLSQADLQQTAAKVAGAVGKGKGAAKSKGMPGTNKKKQTK